VPLPTTSVAWPPVALAQITPILGAWDAWWTGQPDALQRIYTSRGTPVVNHSSQFRGGVAGKLSRWWWGRPTAVDGQVHDQTHVPLAADMCRTSADLLFADPPTFTVDDPKTQERIDAAIGDRTYATLSGAAEAGAALGGVYLRVVCDPAVASAAFITAVNADEAVPEFNWGHLVAVTFWHVVADDGATVVRHLERHELVSGLGLIQHGLYVGTADLLGRAHPLAEHPSTANLDVDENAYAKAGRTPGLGVVYIPNTEPNVAKAFRGLASAHGWGASDLDGVEPMLDNLDEIYSSWMRDIRLAKGRLLVAQYMLQDNGAGKGASFNADQEVFTALNMAAAEEGDAPITSVQFAIRFEAHQASAEEWTSRILRSAGYSTQTFGEGADVAQTATEVTARQARSLMTRDRKIRAWRPALTQILGKLLEVDVAVFGGTVDLKGLKVTFSDGSQDSVLVLAQTALALSTAQAASTATLVGLVHPDWDATQVDAEVALINEATPAPMASPFTFGG